MVTYLRRKKFLFKASLTYPRGQLLGASPGGCWRGQGSAGEPPWFDWGRRQQRV